MNGRVTYGYPQKIGDRRFLQLKEVNLQFFTNITPGYGDSLDYNDILKAQIKVEATDRNNDEWKPFGASRYASKTSEFTMGLGNLSPTLQQKVKDLWLEIEEEMVKGATEDV